MNKTILKNVTENSYGVFKKFLLFPLIHNSFDLTSLSMRFLKQNDSEFSFLLLF